ncbi:MAG: FAD:protein FMN transferase [Pseudomonadota bacterium]
MSRTKLTFPAIPLGWWVLLCIASVQAQAEWHRASADIMGTRISVELYHADADKAAEVMAAVMDEMHRIDHAYSPYKPASQLSTLNSRASKDWVEVSEELYMLLRQSIKMSEMTDGAFDVTFGSVGRFYDYRDKSAPDDETIAETVQAIDYRHLLLNQATRAVKYANPYVYVDLGGIAKGYAVDRGAAILTEAGATQASVSAGGDSVIIGDRRGKPWTVGIKHPRQPDKMVAILPLEDTAVSTSGDYERFFVRDGVRYHHILDPQTGRSAQGSWSVTVLGPQGMITDALSTSVFVLGPEKGLALIDKLPGVDAIIIDPQGKLLFSADLAELAP